MNPSDSSADLRHRAGRYLQQPTGYRAFSPAPLPPVPPIRMEGELQSLLSQADRVARRIREDIAPKVAADPAYKNAKKNTPNAARIEHDKALAKVMLTLLKDDTQVYKQFVENESFKRFVTDMVYALTNEG